MSFADQFARQSARAGDARSELPSRLPLTLHALLHGLTTVFFMSNLSSPHQAAHVTLQLPAVQREAAE